MGFLSCAAFIFQNQLHVTPIDFSWLIIAVTAAAIFGRFANFFLLRVLSENSIVIVALVFKLFAAILLLVLILISKIHIWTILLPVALYMSTNSLLFPNILSALLTAFPAVVGAAVALYGTIQMLGSTMGSSIIAVFAHQQPLAIAVFLLFLAITSLLLFIFKGDPPKSETVS